MLKATEIQSGDTVFQQVRSDPGTPAYIRHVRVLANEPGTVVHGPGTLRVRFLSGTDTVTGHTVRWTLPLSYWQNGLRSVPLEQVQEFLPQRDASPDAVQRMLAAAGR